MDSLKIICAADVDNTIVSLGEVPKFEKGQLVRVIDGVFKKGWLEELHAGKDSKELGLL